MEKDSDSEYELAHEKFPEEELIEEALKSQAFAEYQSHEETPVLAEGNQVDKEELKNDVNTQELYDDDELIEVRSMVLHIKSEANDQFHASNYGEAADLYTEAIELCRQQLNVLKAVLLANRAACHLKNLEYEKTEEDCSAVIELDPAYMKALLRRAYAREQLDKLTLALEDYKQVLEIDPCQSAAREAVSRLPGQIEIQQEKMKEECIGKLKDLGNIVLKPFGLSTDNFKMVQDPASGGYNIQFSQEK